MASAVTSGGVAVSSSRWGRTGEPGAAFLGVGRGGRGRGRGRGRGGSNPGSGRGGTPATAEIGTTSSTASSSGGRRKAASTRDRKPPPSPLTLNSTSTSTSETRPKNNRRKRNNNSSTTSNVSAKSLDPPSSAVNKDAPVHVSSTSLNVRHDIETLVERVRAVAIADMHSRPSTPQTATYIDWTTEDDDGSLPDLDDWGVHTKDTVQAVDDAAEKEKDIEQLTAQLISPIIVDGLRSLPEPVILAQIKTPKEPERLPLHPSLPARPVVADSLHPSRARGATPMRSIPKETVRRPQKPETSELQDVKVDVPPVSEPTENPQTTPERPDSLVKIEQSSPSEDEPVVKMPLAQRISSPSMSPLSKEPSSPHSAPPITVGRNFRGGIRGHRAARSGSSTPLSSDNLTPPRFNHHARNHSTPSATPVSSHRVPHSRPVLTGNALSILARSIGVTENK